MEDEALVERCLALAINNALGNGCIGPGALGTIGVSRTDATLILGIAVDQGDLVVTVP